jgi:ATP-dependent Clp protease protease subunit
MRLHKDNIDRFFDFGFHLETRTIYIGTEIDEESAEKVIKAIHLLRASDDTKEIKVILNCPGGAYYNGMAIYDAIMACPFDVTVEVLGHAMSMASIILQAGDVRVVHPNSTLLIHDGYEGIEGATPKSFEAWAKESKSNRRTMYEIFAHKSGKAEAFWEKRCSHDYFLTAREAVSLGLADKIAGEEDSK